MAPGVSRCLADQFGGEWNSTRALAEAKRDGGAGDIPALAKAAEAALAPMCHERLKERLGLLGAAMAPNRSQQDGAAWLFHMASGLRGMPEDLVLDAIDEHVRRSTFLPSVAELLERIEPQVGRRRKEASRLDCLARLIASGADIPAAPLTPRFEEPEPFREEDRCTPEQAAAILEEMGIGSSAAETAKRHLGAPRKPTREDYISLGVDPSVFDQEEREAA